MAGPSQEEVGQNLQTIIMSNLQGYNLHDVGIFDKVVGLSDPKVFFPSWTSRR